MEPVVVTVTREELEERRGAILRSLGMTREKFRQLDASRTLTGEEWRAKDELDDIEFLLGDTSGG